MTLKQYKTCTGCRANENANECSLYFALRDYKPLELCPKPKTIVQLINASKERTRLTEKDN
jgi:hypothetical protein